MDTNKAIKYVEEVLSTQRFDHTMRVYEQAIKLARIYNLSEKNIGLAALFHDISKEESNEMLREAIINYELPSELLQYDKELWHGPVAAMKIREEFPDIDKSIIEAIYYHTTGKPSMTRTTKVIFVADYIEPARRYPGVEDVRETAINNLNRAVAMTLRNTILYLVT